MDGSGKTNMTLYEKNTKDESEFKNYHNAEINYKEIIKHQQHIKDGIALKINNGRYEKLYNPTTGEDELVWTVIDPIYALFSWKDKKDNNCGFPISLHMDTLQFENELNKFIKAEYRKEEPSVHRYL